jgi:hypothetical protein
MKKEAKFNLELIFEDKDVIKLNHVKSSKIFQQLRILSPYFSHPKNLINQYIEKMKQQKSNETKTFIVPEARLRAENYYRLSLTKID